MDLEQYKDIYDTPMKYFNFLKYIRLPLVFIIDIAYLYLNLTKYVFEGVIIDIFVSIIINLVLILIAFICFIKNSKYSWLLFIFQSIYSAFIHICFIAIEIDALGIVLTFALLIISLTVFECLYVKKRELLFGEQQQTFYKENVSDENVELNNEVKYCRKCGTKLEVEAKFCKKCGERVI